MLYLPCGKGTLGTVQKEQVPEMWDLPGLLGRNLPRGSWVQDPCEGPPETWFCLVQPAPGPKSLFLSFSYHFIPFSLPFEGISLKFMEFYVMRLSCFVLFFVLSLERAHELTVLCRAPWKAS